MACCSSKVLHQYWTVNKKNTNGLDSKSQTAFPFCQHYLMQCCSCGPSNKPVPLPFSNSLMILFQENKPRALTDQFVSVPCCATSVDSIYHKMPSQQFNPCPMYHYLYVSACLEHKGGLHKEDVLFKANSVSRIILNAKHNHGYFFHTSKKQQLHR